MFYKKTVSELTKHNNLKDLADAYIGLARLYEKENKPDSAIYYAKKGFTIAQSSSFKKWVYETSLILSRVYEKKMRERLSIITNLPCLRKIVCSTCRISQSLLTPGLMSSSISSKPKLKK